MLPLEPHRKRMLRAGRCDDPTRLGGDCAHLGIFRPIDNVVWTTNFPTGSPGTGPPPRSPFARPLLSGYEVRPSALRTYWPPAWTKCGPCVAWPGAWLALPSRRFRSTDTMPAAWIPRPVSAREPLTGAGVSVDQTGGECAPTIDAASMGARLEGKRDGARAHPAERRTPAHMGGSPEHALAAAHQMISDMMKPRRAPDSAAGLLHQSLAPE